MESIGASHVNDTLKETSVSVCVYVRVYDLKNNACQNPYV